jgi:hypothetical protein
MSRFIFPKQSSAIWFLVAAILCLAAALLAYPGKAGLVREAQLAGIRKGEGFLLTAPYPPEMKKSYGRVFLPQDDLVVLEDGEALPVLAPGKKDIELAGWGRFRAGSEEILFSTSDGNELDGRIYRIRWPAWSVREWIPGILFLLGFAAFGVGAAQLQPLSRRLASGLGAALSGLIALGMLLLPERVADGFFTGVGLPLAWSLSVALLANGGRAGWLLLLAAGALLPAWICHQYFAVMGASHPWFLVGGLLPLSDANMHFTQALEILRQGEASTGFNGRFLYPLFLSALMNLTGENAHLIQFFSCTIVLGSLALLARTISTLVGVTGTTVVIFLFWLYFRLNGAWLSMTENLGMPLGLLATGLFVIGARDKRFGICVAGLFLFSAGMATRPGAMFVLPALAVFCVLKFGGGIGNIRRSALIAAVAGAAMLAGLGANSLASARVYKGSGQAYQNFAFSLNGLLTGSDWSRSHDGGKGDPAKVMEENKRLLRENPTLVLTGSLRTLEYLWPRGFFFRFDKDIRFVGIASLVALAGLVALFFQRSLAEQRGWIFAALAGIFLSMPFAPPWDAGSRPYAVTMPIVFLVCGLGVAAFFNLCQHAAVFCGLAKITNEAPDKSQTKAYPLCAAAVFLLLLTAFPLISAKKPAAESPLRLSRPGSMLEVREKENLPQVLTKKDFGRRLSALGMNYPDLQRKFQEAEKGFTLIIDWNGPRFRVSNFPSTLKDQPNEEIHSLVFERANLGGTASD